MTEKGKWKCRAVWKNHCKEVLKALISGLEVSPSLLALKYPCSLALSLQSTPQPADMESTHCAALSGAPAEWLGKQKCRDPKAAAEPQPALGQCPAGPVEPGVPVRALPTVAWGRQTGVLAEYEGWLVREVGHSRGIPNSKLRWGPSYWRETGNFETW